MDAVEPVLVEKAERVIREHNEIKAINRLQMRWLGHQLYAEVVLELDPSLSLTQSEAISDHIRHHLHHTLPRLSEATISTVPEGAASDESEHHREQE
jgi:divalent metal cation (Fe/Co/Zn/Cd) transporter